LGPFRSRGRDDSAPVHRLLPGKLPVGDHDVVSRSLYALRLFHAKREKGGANGSHDDGGGQESVQKETGAPREGPHLRDLLQRQGGGGRGGPLRSLHPPLDSALNYIILYLAHDFL